MKIKSFFDFQKSLIELFLKDAVLFVSFVGLVLTSFYSKKFPIITSDELEVILLLFVLMLVVGGLEKYNLITKLSHLIIGKEGKFVALKLVIFTFFSSMIITNDISILIMVTLTLNSNFKNKGEIIILETVAANAGSALTPIGNPQNLFIYWKYSVEFSTFVSTILPLSLVSFIVLFALSFFYEENSPSLQPESKIQIKMPSFLYLLFLMMIFLVLIHIINIYILVFIIVYILIFDRRLFRIDYNLLSIFIVFFMLSENIKNILTGTTKFSHHVFVFSALVSQVLSNVPTAILFSKFTPNWKALLWGTNVGGFGNIIGSLANLIAFKLFLKNSNINRGEALRFTIKFFAINYLLFFVGIMTYLIIKYFSKLF